MDRGGLGFLKIRGWMDVKTRILRVNTEADMDPILLSTLALIAGASLLTLIVLGPALWRSLRDRVRGRPDGRPAPRSRGARRVGPERRDPDDKKAVRSASEHAGQTLARLVELHENEGVEAVKRALAELLRRGGPR